MISQDTTPTTPIICTQIEIPDMSAADVLEIGAIFVALLSVVIATFALRGMMHQSHMQFEMIYVERFWTLMDQRSKQFRNGKPPRKSDNHIIQDYLALSNDQVGLRRYGRITTSTWKLWRQDIKSLASQSPYRERIDPVRHADLHALIEAKDATWDPIKIGPIRRFLNGI